MPFPANIYESPRLLSEYLLFHYGTEADHAMPEIVPRAALEFSVRSVAELLPEEPEEFLRALDLGCAVGRSSFVLSERCMKVFGIDFSQSFVEAAERLRLGEVIAYERLEEGKRYSPLEAVAPSGAKPERIQFECGDAMNLRGDLGDFDLVHAANLLCRLADPNRLLERLPQLVRPGGVVLLATPCTWLAEFTPPAQWPRGTTREWLREVLAPHFELEAERDMPFVIREHARKYQLTVSLGTRWRRKTE